MRLIAGNSVQIRNLSSTIALSGAMFVGLCGNAFADGREVLEQFFELNRFGSAEATLTVADGDIGESGDYYQYQNVTFGYFNEVEIKFAEILISKDAAFGDESTIPESILNGVTVDVGSFALAVEQISTTGFRYADPGAVLPDTGNQYADFGFSVLAALSGTSFDMQKATGVTYAIKIDDPNAGAEGQATIPTITMENMSNGAIGLVEIPGFSTTQTQSGTDMPTVSLEQTFDRAYVENYDLSALAAWMGMLPNKPAGEWMTLMGRAGYTGYKITEPGVGIDFSIREIVGSGYKVKTGQWTADELVELFNNIEQLENSDAPPPEFFELFDKIYQSMDFGTGEFNDMDFAGPEGATGSLRQISYGPDASGVGGRVAVQGVLFDVPGMANISFDNFALGGLRYPNLAKIGKLIEAEEAGVEYNPLDFLEQMLASVKMDNLKVSALGMNSSLDLFEYQMDKFVGPIPTETRFDLDHLVIPVELIDDPMVVGQLQALGFSQLDISANSNVRFDEAAGSLHIEDVQLRLEDGGHLFFSGELSGLPLLEIRSEEDLEQLMATAVINNVKLRFENLGGVDRGFGFAAQMQGVDATVFRQQIAGAVPFFLSNLGNPDFQAAAAPTIQAFLNDPGSLSVFALPGDPVAVLQLMALAESNPGKIIDLLGVKVEANTPQ